MRNIEDNKYFIDRTSNVRVINNQLLIFDNNKYYLYDLNSNKVLLNKIYF